MEVTVIQNNDEALRVFNFFAEMLAKQSTTAVYEAPMLGTISFLSGKVTASYEVKKTLADAVSQTGEAIYDWLTGMSKRNEISFHVDGYPMLVWKIPLYSARVNEEIIYSDLSKNYKYFLDEALARMIDQGELPETAKLPEEPPPRGEAASDEVEPHPRSDLRGGKSDAIGNSGNLVLPDWRKEDELRTYWEELWKHFGIKLDPSPTKLVIPKITENYFAPHAPHLLIMPKGLRLNQLRDIMKALFSCWFRKKSLDKYVPTNDRTSQERSYALWVANAVDPPEILKNKSADMLAREGIITQVLAERLIQGIERFKLTGSHLDIHNWTLCRGSRWSNGDVPYVGYRVGTVWVDWGRRGSRSGGWRARAAVL